MRKIPAVDDEALADAFWRVAGRLRHGMRETAAPFGVSPASFRALGTLLRHGDMRLKALSDHLHIAPRSATEVVDLLEMRGLVVRQPDPDDRRATIVSVTDEGRRLSDELRAHRVKQGAQLFKDLEDDDRVELMRILSALAQSDADD